MSVSKKNILNTAFDSYTMNDLLTILAGRINNSKQTFLVTANPEIVMYARQNQEYQQIVNEADYVVADGFGVVLGSKILGDPVPERVAGYDLLTALLKSANQNSWSVYFLGAKKNVVEKAVENVKKDHPNLIIAGYHDGYFKDSTFICEQISRTKPDLVFVALGFPKQEKWINENYQRFEKGLFMGVGGSFDVLAGTVKRAPVKWQKFNLEWFYRLLQEPSRWRRMLVLPKFVLKIILQKCKNIVN